MWPCWCLDLRLPAPRPVRNGFLFFVSHPLRAVLSQQSVWTKTPSNVLTLPNTLERGHVFIGEAGQHTGRGFRLGAGHVSSAPCSRLTLAAGFCFLQLLPASWEMQDPERIFPAPGISLPITSSTHLVYRLPWPRPRTFITCNCSTLKSFQTAFGHKLWVCRVLSSWLV